MTQRYADFLATKAIQVAAAGIEIDDTAINANLFPFQRDIVRWALRRGRAAIFADCGMGKTPMQLEWARHIVEATGGNVLILAPLAVARQTQREGAKFGIAVTVCRTAADVRPGINVTNYDRLHHFDPTLYAGIVLDESSILKSLDGKMRQAITDAFGATPYRLCCTATPAPNDHMELGNHAEFLGAQTRAEMLAMFFVHDGGDTSKWRLKGHAKEDFWRWVCSWAVMVRKPSDLGYDDGQFVLPALQIHQHVVASEWKQEGALFALESMRLEERRKARQSSIGQRVAEVATIANGTDEPMLIWCDLNAESEAITKAIPGAVEVRGSDSPESKERAMLGFSDGAIRVLVTKPSIAGFGMNWQHCARVAFVGLSDSYEAYYQAIRRCWRFGQQRQVECHIITADAEGPVVNNIKRKERDAQIMADEMVQHMSIYQDVTGLQREQAAYARNVERGKKWTAHLGDCVEVVSELADNSIDFSVFSPPFASLYTYSNSDRDMGNCKDGDEFAAHFRFLVRDLHRVIKPGRLVAFHCMNLPMMKGRDGEIGMRDFRGDLIRMFQAEGFVFHSEICIWKDPAVEVQRTKSLGLLYKQLKKDSTMSRQAFPDYLVVMRKRGDNAAPVTKDPDDFNCDLWQHYASPVWYDIQQSNTLQHRSARDEKDERHICPLQLEVIERAIRLWTNPGDLVLSPFMGIGSEGYQALKMGRRFVGAEIKESYYRQAVANLQLAAESVDNPTIFDLMAPAIESEESAA